MEVLLKCSSICMHLLNLFHEIHTQDYTFVTLAKQYSKNIVKNFTLCVCFEIPVIEIATKSIIHERPNALGHGNNIDIFN